jgi:hypothetical protein
MFLFTATLLFFFCSDDAVRDFELEASPWQKSTSPAAHQRQHPHARDAQCWENSVV